MFEPQKIVKKYHYLIDKTMAYYLSYQKVKLVEYGDLKLEVESRLLEQLQKYVSPKNSLEVRVSHLVAEYLRTICNDIQDRLLLQQQSPLLIEKYRYQTSAIIKKHIRERHINLDLLTEEVVGILCEKLANNSMMQFRGNSSFRTYLYKVTNNVVIDELRKIDRRIQTYELKPEIAKQTVLRETPNHEQIEALAVALKMLLKPNERSKFELAVKVENRLQLTKSSILQLFPDASKDLCDNILEAFGDNYALMKKGMLWEALNYFLTELTGKKESIRTLQDWLDKKKYAIVSLLLKKNIQPNDLETKKIIDEYFEELLYAYYYQE